MKNKLIKSIFAIVLCLTMVLPFAACGSNDDGGNTTPTGELTFDEAGNVVFKNVTIQLNTVVDGVDKDPFQALVNRFNSIYDGKINVIVSNTGWSSYESTVSQAISANSKNSPDFLMMHQKSINNFAAKELIVPFDNALNASNISVDLKNFPEKMLKYTTYNGGSELYSIPLDAQSHVVYYNKKELAKIGMAIPTNYQELVAVCKKYKEQENQRTIEWATSDQYLINYTYITAILQNGGKIYNEKTGKVEWYDDATTRNAISQASEFFRYMIRNGYAGYNVADTTNVTNFLNQDCLFLFYDPWAVSDLIKNYADQYRITKEEVLEEYVGCASVSNWFAQTDNAQKNYIYGDSHYFALSRTCKNIEKQAAVLEFINWMTTDPTAGSEWANAGHISLSKAILNSEEYQNNNYVKLLNSFYGDSDNFVCIGATTQATNILTGIKVLFTETVDVNTNNLDYSKNKVKDEEKIRDRQETLNDDTSFFG